MSIALVIIKKDVGGHTWSNTHAVQIGAGTTGIPTDADLASIGAGGAFTAALTASGGGTNFLQRLISFERLNHGPAVHFNTVYLTDGKNGKEAGSPKVYYTAALDLVGLSGQFDAGVLHYIPGGITWMLRRNVVGFSHKPGRLYFRGALAEADIQMNGQNMVDWETTTVRDSFTGQITSSLSGSGLGTHLYGGTNAAAALYGVAAYARAIDVTDPLAVGDLFAVLPCSGFTNGGPVLRQVRRGKKKKKV